MKMNFERLSSEELSKVINASRSVDLNDIQQYRELYLSPPAKNWDPEEFKKRSYEIAALNELQSLVMINPEMTVEEIVDFVLDDLQKTYEDPDTPIDVFEILECVFETFETFAFWRMYHNDWFM